MNRLAATCLTLLRDPNAYVILGPGKSSNSARYASRCFVMATHRIHRGALTPYHNRVNLRDYYRRIP